MEKFIIQNLGLIGAFIFLSAYVPQIKHLLKVKDSTGISVFSWIVWLVGALMLFIYAAYNKDWIFIILTSLELLGSFTIIMLSMKYKKETGFC